MFRYSVFFGSVLISLIFVFAAVCPAQFPEKDHLIEVPPDTKLCDPAEDVYGFYLVKSKMSPHGTQEVEYFRFSTYSDPQTGTLIPKLQRKLIVWFRKHPRLADKLEVINAMTGEADEFPYGVCKK
jgi:hypothetical protein